MTSETTPEQALASAYLDGDVTTVERARVDGSPELLAVVATMRRTATMIAAVDSPRAATREASIAAALAEFDALSNGSVVSLASRRRWPTAVLTAAAAVVLVGVVGTTVLRNTDDSNSDSASLATDTKRAETVAAEDAVGGAQPTQAVDEVLQSVAPVLEIDDPQDLSSLALPAPINATTSPVADTTADAGETTAATERLDSYNVDALACMTSNQVFLADIYYRGTLAIAARDTVTGVTEAIDGNCTVLARVNP